ncbi:MAG TPA: sensor histidine kinase [Chitinophagaceae bacterium]|nr:sensor histidine kinase [Chitinophagaceae bacterium]
MKGYKSYFIAAIVMILLGSQHARAQGIPDSLQQKLNKADNDSVRARALLDIGEAIEVTATTESLVYYQQALALSKKIKNNRLILSSMNDIGVCYIELNKMDSAILSFQAAIPVAKELNDTLRVARITANIGNVFLHKNDPIHAIDYYLQAAKLWETCGDKNRLPALYSNICSLLSGQKEFDKSIEYGNKALDLAQKLGDDYSEVNAMINLSETYSQTGKEALQFEFLQKALPLAKKGEDIEQIATVYEDLGAYYFEKKDYSPSLSNYLEGHKYVLQMGNQYHLSTSFYMLSNVYHHLKQNDKALQYILQAEKIAIEVGARADLKNIYKTRAEIEQALGNYKVASEYFSKTLTLSDSLFKTSTSEKVAEVEAIYQNEKKQQEIIQLQKDKEIQSLTIKHKSTLNYILFGSIGVLLLTGFLIYRNIRNRHLLTKKEAELQQHRISELEKDKKLVAVDSLLKGQEEERSRLAKDLHDGLGGLLSGVKYSLSNMKDNLVITPDNMAVFERSLDMIDTSINELRRVAHNMMPEMLMKFGLDEALKEYCIMINSARLISVKYQSVGMDARLDRSVEIIIYRIVQELLNNTMKHAVATESFVQLIRDGNRLNVVVEDNGKGFDSSLKENQKGAGLANIRSRVDYLKGQLAIHAEPGKGTLVNIEFNI